MKIGNLVRYGGALGILLRKLQYENDDDVGQNWDGEGAWWIQFIDDGCPLWTYEDDLTLVAKGN